MRDTFSQGLTELGKQDKRIVLLTGDHGYALFDQFRSECPEQYINAGIAEQNMVGMAAGLARGGYRPVVYGLSAFIPVRVLEQIKLDVAHDHLPVIFVGDGAGFVYSHLGTSHQSTEDMACCRAIPNVRIFSPADAIEMKACLRASYSVQDTVYLRMGKADRGRVHSQALNPESLHQPILIKQGQIGAGALIATGSMVMTAISLSAQFPLMALWSVPCIKPLNAPALCGIAGHSHSIITLEEHSIFGGLGSAVAEILSETIPTRILRIGVEDRFSEKCGTYEYLLKEHGLDTASIAEKISQYLKV